MSLPQAPPIDDAPHHTRECQASLGTAERCERMNNIRMKTPGRPPKASVMVRGGKPPFACPSTDKPPSARAAPKQQASPSRERGSRDDASKEETSPTGAVVARPWLDRVFTPRQCATRWQFQIGSLSRDSDARRHRRQSTRGSWRELTLGTRTTCCNCSPRHIRRRSTVSRLPPPPHPSKVPTPRSRHCARSKTTTTVADHPPPTSAVEGGVHHHDAAPRITEPATAAPPQHCAPEGEPHHHGANPPLEGCEACSPAGERVVPAAAPARPRRPGSCSGRADATPPHQSQDRGRQSAERRPTTTASTPSPPRHSPGGAHLRRHPPVGVATEASPPPSLPSCSGSSRRHARHLHRRSP
jgi:hypothetical protein